ncbi:MAG TPA: DinB family protein [Actinomycetota bacterium]|nr:DinB family protein [Actinomycetota bacterium]
MSDAPFVEDNARELQRLHNLVARLSDEDLRLPVNEHWTVAATLGHMAFWDARAMYLAERFDPASGFPEDVDEPDNVDWINDSTRSLIHAIDPRGVADLAVRTAEDIDARVAELPAEKVWPNDPDSPLNGRRASHRAEHLDEIEGALG